MCLLNTLKHFMFLLLILAIVSWVDIICSIFEISKETLFVPYLKLARRLKLSDVRKIIKLNKYRKVDLNPIFIFPSVWRTVSVIYFVQAFRVFLSSDVEDLVNKSILYTFVGAFEFILPRLKAQLCNLTSFVILDLWKTASVKWG